MKPPEPFGSKARRLQWTHSAKGCRHRRRRRSLQSRDLPVGVDGAQGLVSEAARAVRRPELDASGGRIPPKDAVIAAAGEVSSSGDLPAGVDGAQGLVGETPRAVRAPNPTPPVEALRHKMAPLVVGGVVEPLVTKPPSVISNTVPPVSVKRLPLVVPKRSPLPSAVTLGESVFPPKLARVMGVLA